MAKQKGQLLLVKIGDGQITEAFSVLCGMNSKSFTLNNNSFEVTTPNSDNPDGQIWREVMTGVRSLTFSGNGYFEDSAAEARLLAVTNGTGATDTADAIANFQVIVPGVGTFEGAFHVDSCVYGGETEGGVTYSLSLSSTGAPTFVAAS